MSGLDLYQTQGQLLRMLLWATATGIGLGGFYDLLRVLRILFSGKREEGSTLISRFVLFFEDVLFALVFMVALILLCYYTNDGMLRAPAAFGVAGGFFVYVETLGKWTVKVEKALSRLLKRMVMVMLVRLRRPLVWLASEIKGKLCRAWYSLFGRAIRRHREKKRCRQEKRRRASSEKPSSPKGKTVFSTRRSM